MIFHFNWITKFFLTFRSYLRDNGGVETDQSYPYSPVHESCKFESDLAVVNVAEVNDLSEKSEDDLKDFIESKGPVSVRKFWFFFGLVISLKFHLNLKF